jgi:hypothetical protein
MTINDVTGLDRVEENLENSDARAPEKKAHPWRRCSIGKHLVREHPVHVPPSKSHPGGVVTTWHEHCANNPSHKEELSYAEIQYITETYFAYLSGPPAAGVLTEYPNADKFDQQIRGWVRYWNDIFQPSVPLDPLKRTASWEEAIIEYKGYWDTINKGEIPLAIKHLRVFYKRLQGK